VACHARIAWMKAQCNATVLENREIGPSLWHARLGLDTADRNLLKAARAGMFAMIRCSENGQLRFRRPFSFAGVDASKGHFTFYYRVFGEQTDLLSKTPLGSSLSCILPLGNCFQLPADGEEAVLVAGGVGVAPLLLLADELKRAKKPASRFYFGARTEAELTCNYLAGYPASFNYATDDGSIGHKGNVVELLMKEGFGLKPHIYACGPSAMLKALAQQLPAEVTAEASLEEVMACGIGACYGCAVHGDGVGVDEMKLVCRDGPVFPLRSIRFE
jgi:dihydroorotate dehydrogenase electron transfer subunit